MAVRKRKDTKGTSWQARWKNPQGKWQSKDFNTKAEAEQYYARMIADVSRGAYTNPQTGKVLVRDVYEAWEETQVNLKPKTKDDYKSLWINMVEPTWGNKSLLQVTRADFKTWANKGISRTGKKVSPSRIRKSAVVLNLIMDHAVDMRHIPNNPLGKMQGVLPKLTISRKRIVLEQNELTNLANECGEYKLMILIAGHLGLRWAELIALTATDLDFTNKVIHVNKSLSEVNSQFTIVSTKTGNERTVPIPDFMMSDLAALAIATPAEQPIFTSKEGTYLRKSNFARRYFKPALERAGLNNITFHELRHTAISHLMAMINDPVLVAKIAGHSSPSTTLRIYSHELQSANEQIREVIEKNHLQSLGNARSA